MSMWYSIHITLDAKPSLENIEHILQKVTDNGSTLQKQNFDIKKGESYLTIDPKSAALLIFDAMKVEDKFDDASYSGVLTNYEKTSCALMFHEKENNLEVSISLLTDIKKRHNDRWSPDFAYYIKFLLMACEDFYIVKIETIAT